MLTPRTPWPRWLALPSMAVGVLLAAMLGAYLARQSALHALAEQSTEQMRLHVGALQALIDRYRALPTILALDPELRSALASPPDAVQTDRLNRKLERVNDPAGASTLTLLNAQGLAIAASNWRVPENNVGHDYGFRPYFQQALQQGVGRFYAVGVTTQVPGYFLSEALHDEQGQTLGVVVVKIELEALSRSWATGPDAVLVSDAHGVVLLASETRWRYRELLPISPEIRQEIEATQQFAHFPLKPMDRRRLESLGVDGDRVRVYDTGVAGDYLWLSRPMPAEGWTLHLLRDTGPVLRTARLGALIGAGSVLGLILIALLGQQQLRLARLRQRSRAELESMVRQHAEALRNAEDGVVVAAERAAVGQSASLEHLPQGVSVVDAEQRLVAWNRRYVEIFRCPPELMRVGRPIEDLIRHNLRRGLIAAGADPEEAVQRRLEHLRSGSAYMFEREWADGTVLEIRGNPLPGGGFVTSYADITAYRTTARELRSLAGSLERRIDERTRDLAEAREDAERANRSKSRFVAAAVHDLLQPLNAARMFATALKARQPDPPSLALAGHIEDALNAQDGILSSLLDIARLEAGTIDTTISDWPLEQLLESLARDFGVLAEARGLRLRRAHSRAVVRSDATLLRRIVQNFLSNAIRYTARGSVLLGVRRLPGAVRIEVWDTGCGIAEHQRAEIFEEFRRLDAAVSDANARGAGLGLAIVERIARRLGHEIGLRSWPGRGSVFSVVVPLGDATAVRLPEPASAQDEGTSSLAGRRILCIDDEPLVREASRALLSSWGCVVQALAPNEALADPMLPAPELLLLDEQLGEALRGSALYDQLCARWGQEVPVILATAEQDPALRSLARARGWGFLAKPLRPPALRALIRQLLLRGARPAEDSA